MHDAEQSSHNFKNLYKKGELSGKYLNELHQFFIKYNFYDSLYVKILMQYLEHTNFQTLKSVSIDSFFVRNILGENLQRNSYYNNKSGLKVHSIVDSNGVVLSLYVSEGIVNDSVTINMLLKNLFIDKDLFCLHIDEFLADSAYSGISNIYNLTMFGFRVVMGRNKQHVKKTDNIALASDKQIIHYKKRGIVENTFGQIERYPILLNNYQRNIESYRGLLLFVLASGLSKRHNIAIKKDTDDEFKKKEEINKLKKIQDAKERKQKLYEFRKKQKQQKEKDDKNRKIINIELENKIKESICKCIDENKLKKIYEQKILGKEKSKKIKKNQKLIDKNNKIYNKYVQFIKNNIYIHVKNNILVKTLKYTFGKKELYMTEVDKNTFTDGNIMSIMNNPDQLQKIDNLCNSFLV